MNLFYTTHVIRSDSGEARSCVLEGSEAHHATHVLRMSTGDPLFATDGEGALFDGVIESVEKEEVRISIRKETVHTGPAPEITIAVGLIKKRDRLEFAVEKAVELGVTRFVIFRGDRSEKKGVRVDRLQAAALSAMKQSLRCWAPEVVEADSVEEVLKQAEAKGIKTVIADEQEEPGRIGRRTWNRFNQLLFVVGPEGGFSDRERELFQTVEADRFSLGRYRLRTETAVIAIAGLFQE
ncbi:MAG: RsmE family RNA methyltransferase [Balneolaceae bacterium]